MPTQRFVLHCPTCGRVTVTAPAVDPDDIDGTSDDDVLEEQEFETPAGPVTRVRCPRCGRWLSTDLAEPD
ncbi:MAG: hypothetical protein ACP5HU_10920 [Phycisphaerae bacterium]